MTNRKSRNARFDFFDCLVRKDFERHSPSPYGKDNIRKIFSKNIYGISEKSYP